MTTTPEPMPGEDPGVPPDEQLPDTEPELPDFDAVEQAEAIDEPEAQIGDLV